MTDDDDDDYDDDDEDKDDDSGDDKFTSCWLQKEADYYSYLFWVSSRFSSILPQVLPRYPSPPGLPLYSKANT